MNNWEIEGEIVSQEAVRNSRDGSLLFQTTIRDDESRLVPLVLFKTFPPGTRLRARGVLSMNKRTVRCQSIWIETWLRARGVLSMNKRGFLQLKSKWVDRVKTCKTPKTEEPPREEPESEETTRHSWLQGAFRSLARV